METGFISDVIVEKIVDKVFTADIWVLPVLEKGAWRSGLASARANSNSEILEFLAKSCKEVERYVEKFTQAELSSMQVVVMQHKWHLQ